MEASADKGAHKIKSMQAAQEIHDGPCLSNADVKCNGLPLGEERSHNASANREEKES